MYGLGILPRVGSKQKFSPMREAPSLSLPSVHRIRWFAFFLKQQHAYTREECQSRVASSAQLLTNTRKCSIMDTGTNDVVSPRALSLTRAQMQLATISDARTAEQRTARHCDLFHPCLSLALIQSRRQTTHDSIGDAFSLLLSSGLNYSRSRTG